MECITLNKIKKIAQIEYDYFNNIIGVDKSLVKSEDNIRLFFRWLKLQGIYSSYIKEVEKYKNRGYTWNSLTAYEFIQKRLDNTIYNIIDTTLYWADTEQGHDFWSFYNTLYSKHVNGNFLGSLKDIKHDIQSILY